MGIFLLQANQEALKMAGRGSRIGGRMGRLNIPGKKRPMVVYDTEQTVGEPKKEAGTDGKRAPVAKKSTAQRKMNKG